MTKTKKHYFLLFLSLALLIGIGGFFNVADSYAAKKPHFNKKAVTLISGNTFQQKLIDKNGKTINAKKVAWKSNNTSVAKVTKKGKVTALKAGKTIIIGKYKGKKFKFKVTVKKPFSAGAKPTISKVKREGTSNDPYIAISWSLIKNAQEYQVYVSINNGAYKEISVPYKNKGWFFDVEFGYKYSFKVRAKAGKYYSAFSKVESIEIPKKTILLDSSEITVEINKTKTITVTTNLVSNISYQTSNSYVNCSWGGWNGDLTSLTVKGAYEGTTEVTIFDTDFPSVKKTLTVHVVPPAINITIPSVPATYIDSSSDLKQVKIDKIEIETTYLKTSNEHKVVLHLNGEKIFDYNPDLSSNCAVGYKIYDADEYVVESGIFYSDAIKQGEKFKGEKTLGYLKPGNYRLELLGVKK